VSVVDAVLLDLGNVLVGWDPRRAFEGATSPEKVDAFFVDVDFVELNRRQDAGRTWAQARDDVAARHPQHAAMVDLYVDRFEASLTGPVEGTAELVEQLRATGIRLFGLTNWSAELFWAAAPAAPAIARLEDVLVSGREGLVKPDPRIFALAIERFALEPGRTLFVDDAAANVEGAARLGLRTHLFTSADRLRVELRGLGVDVSAPDPRRGPV
jgi:2-haloacid dehalogenase